MSARRGALIGAKIVPAKRPAQVWFAGDPPQRTNEKYTCTVVDIISTHDTRTIVRMYQQDTASAL